jgi:hypothetical protein
MENKYLKISCNKESLQIIDNSSLEEVIIPWNTVFVQYGEQVVTPVITEINDAKNSIVVKGGIDTLSSETVIILREGEQWCSIQTTLSDATTITTPDVVQLAASDSLVFEKVGYQSENAYREGLANADLDAQAGEEASNGFIPGCGYPIFSPNVFVGIAHVAGFTLIRDKGFYCHHYQTWEEGVMKLPPVVVGVKGGFPSIKKSFLNYIDNISIPKQQNPILCCCTFWTDPYIGDCEYKVNVPHYQRYIKQFLELGIKPDMLMLDAGWNDRQSIFQAKEDIGRDAGLKLLSDSLAKKDIKFALWSSINGNMGISYEWAEKEGYPVGTGFGAAYSFPNQFVVLLENRRFEKEMIARYNELVETVDCKFFKIDWDCETATNKSFSERYPTPHHVRVATIDAFNRIHSGVMKKHPETLMRNGWWPSPWWLKDVTFTWLAHSGDCEYSQLPSLTQRDRETTHRDTMYYYIFKQDNTPLPFDSMDNHEIIKAFRNPFAETFESWCNSAMMLHMRGTIYLSVMINAATMKQEEATFFNEARAFVDQYAHILFNKSAQFIGGNPGLGEVYGFLHQTDDESIVILRNPSVEPIEVDLEFCRTEVDFSIDQTVGLYPYCSDISDKNSIELLTHQTVVLYFKKERDSIPKELRGTSFIIGETGAVYLAAGLEKDDSFGTIQEEFVMTRNISIESLGETKDGDCVVKYLKVMIPDKMDNPMALFKLEGASLEQLKEINIELYHDRYPKTGDGHAIAMTTVATKKQEGYGAMRNQGDRKLEQIQYRTAPIPTGGEFYLNIEIQDKQSLADLKVTMYVEGLRGKSRLSKVLTLPEVFKHIPKTHNGGKGEFASIVL